MNGDLPCGVVGDYAADRFRLARLVGGGADNVAGVERIAAPTDLQVPLYGVGEVGRLHRHAVGVPEALAQEGRVRRASVGHDREGGGEPGDKRVAG